MDAVEYLKARGRYWKNGNTGMTMRLEKADPEKAVCEIEKWAEKYHVKTMRDDFFEKFPNAPRKHDGTPFLCPGVVYGDAHSRCSGTGCYDCWSRPLEEEK